MVIPPGKYRVTSLFLKSNTTLYLEKGAVLLGDNDRTHYPILPGVIRTPAMESWATEAMQAAFLDLQNVPQLGEPRDIAAMAAFLASDDAAYVNGTLMRVDGGMSCGTPMVPVVRNLLLPQASA